MKIIEIIQNIRYKISFEKIIKLFPKLNHIKLAQFWNNK